MTALLLAAALAFSVLVAVNFRAAALLYIGVYQIIPITISVDLGTSLPLVTLTRLLLLPLLAGFAVRVLTGRLRLDGIPFWLPLAFFAFALVSAMLLSEYRNSAGTLKVFSFVVEEWTVLVIASSVIRTRKDGETAIAILLAGVIASLIFAGYELAADRNPLLDMAANGRENLIYDYSIERRFGLRRIQSFFRNPLDYGIYLSLLMPVAAAYRVDATGWRRTLAMAVLVGGAVAVALTLSRTAIYSLLVSSVVYFSMRRQWGALLKGALTLVTIVALITLIFGFPLGDYLYRSAVAPEQLQGDLGGSSLSSLFMITGNHLDMAVQHPVFGRGLGTMPPAEAGSMLDPMKVGFGEQGFSFLLVEAGVIGLAAFVTLLAAMTLRLRHGWQRAPDPFTRRMSLGTLCALAGWIVSSELAGVWHLSLLLVLVAIAVRMQLVADEAPPARA